MKKQFWIVICALVLSALCACGEKEPVQTAQPVEEQTAASAAAEEKQEQLPEEAPVEEAPVEEELPEQQPVEPEAAEEAPQTDPDVAMQFIDCELNELIAVLGEPDSASYEESCSGPGDDGILHFGDICVYTYRENGTETIIDVE